jgi:hypothetical protein
VYRYITKMPKTAGFFSFIKGLRIRELKSDLCWYRYTQAYKVKLKESIYVGNARFSLIFFTLIPNDSARVYSEKSAQLSWAHST